MLMTYPPFSPRMDLDRQQVMWDLWVGGKQMSQAAVVLDVDRKTVYNRISRAGGIRPRRRQTRSRLSYADRVHIEIGRQQQRSIRAIAADLGRDPSTISREIVAHAGTDGRYRAKRAHAMAFEKARRPQPCKVDSTAELRAQVLAGLAKKRSPEQIAGRLREDFPEDPEMWVHHETIYRWIYLQPRGELKRQVSAALRSGRVMRQPQAHGRRSGQGQIPEMLSIHERPPINLEDGTRIPGHWEGDLILGKNNASAIGTVVERATGYLMLLHLPQGRTAEHVAAALTRRLAELPASLRQSLTWDQGKEMSKHTQVKIDAGIEVYFADPHTPWHRPSNENTNGLLRQYFPKGTDLSAHSAEHLLFVEHEMNDRPRKRLDFAKPQELMTQLLLGV
jgi:IS30 family transposase